MSETPKRVVFTTDIEELECGDHPTLLLAERGQEGELIDVKGGYWPAYVRLAGGSVIGCHKTEIKEKPCS